ncbi:hypothetical protein [Paraburkholderia sp.]|uniref:hypothetical protein n=1 Tax=Paraburkholderia sp. TaxID=1926495 RepID=UPI003D6FC449
MTHSPQRHAVLLTAAVLPFAMSLRARADTASSAIAGAADFASLEHDAGGRLGVFAIDTATGRQTGYRAGERFPVCSTFKLIVLAVYYTQRAKDCAAARRRDRRGRTDRITPAGLTPAQTASRS